MSDDRRLRARVARMRQPDGKTRPLFKLAHFLVAIKDAMQNWRDNAQASLPGFRDRIVSLKLAQGEGGLNLAMDAAKIAS